MGLEEIVFCAIGEEFRQACHWPFRWSLHSKVEKTELNSREPCLNDEKSP